MQEETSEHVRVMIQVFEFVVLPASIMYLFGDLVLLRENALNSVIWGILIFFYSNFVPDLTCIYGRKNGKGKGKREDLPWYKKYALLLLAPLFICLLFSNTRLSWKTTEDFHNFKSMTVYGVFLFFFGFFLFGGIPVSIEQISKMLSLPLYGVIGYLTHLKVDKIL